VLDVVGPLGKPTEIEKFGHVVLVGGGVGTAVIYPQAGALKAIGNRVSAASTDPAVPMIVTMSGVNPARRATLATGVESFTYAARVIR